MRQVAMAVGLLVWVVAPCAWGMGSDHQPGPLRLVNWTDGFTEVANAHRVHGYWINENDVLFFAGDTAALSRFLREYAGLPVVHKRVTLGRDRIVVRSPWDEGPRLIEADWSFTSELWVKDAGLHLIPPPEQPLSEWELYRPKSRAAVAVDVTRVDLGALRVPLLLEVRAGAKADDAVRRFVEAHQKRQAKAVREAEGVP